MPPPGWADYPVFGVSPGTAITPNYVDNASARVEPWCDCRASGNRREECEVFRGLFTRNRCLGEGPGKRGAREWRGPGGAGLQSALTAPSQAAWLAVRKPRSVAEAMEAHFLASATSEAVPSSRHSQLPPINSLAFRV